jgi:hypothetical protein
MVQGWRLPSLWRLSRQRRDGHAQPRGIGRCCAADPHAAARCHGSRRCGRASANAGPRGARRERGEPGAARSGAAPPPPDLPRQRRGERCRPGGCARRVRPPPARPPVGAAAGALWHRAAGRAVSAGGGGQVASARHGFFAARLPAWAADHLAPHQAGEWQAAVMAGTPASGSAELGI